MDIVPLSFTLNNMYGPPLSPTSDTELLNKLSGVGVGWHGGVLFQVAQNTRFGLSAQSKVDIHTIGRSSVYLASGTVLGNTRQVTDASLPARAQVSLQHDMTEKWTGMATIFYTHWKTFREITMKHTMLPSGGMATVTIPFNYHNCLDYAVGASYKATDKWIFRGGYEYMGTPSNNVDRGIADPVGGASVITAGLHYKQNEKLSYDVGVSHSFFKPMPVNLTNALTSLRGQTRTQTSAFGGQINWNIS